MCAPPCGDQRLQLARQLTAAALNLNSGSSATFADFASCNATCANSNASKYALSDCENKANGFNSSGDCQQDCFGSYGPADGIPCGLADSTVCTLLNPTPCSVH
jgi:hypothetical protein